MFLTVEKCSPVNCYSIVTESPPHLSLSPLFLSPSLSFSSFPHPSYCFAPFLFHCKLCVGRNYVLSIFHILDKLENSLLLVSFSKLKKMWRSR